jgi:hypothetical protein
MQAVSLLRELGYTNVSHYPGGLTEWLAANSPAPTAQSETRTSPATTISRPDSHVAPWSSRLGDTLAERSVRDLFLLWAATVLAWGFVYWLLALRLPGGALIRNGEPLAADGAGALSAVYFSAVTATSIGYGDIVPIGVTRVLAVAEGIAGLILFGCVVSKFVSHRQEEVIGEIHRIAFEDRLGRVRTNLHLVRTEIQATARACEGVDLPPPEAIARVESAAMVFVGELRVVHDLLYRPQQTPDETVLEAILASLASVFREFTELLACKQVRAIDRSVALRTSLDTMTRVAKEICGDCVPREFAPGLRSWMDQIQQMAGMLER